MSTSRHSMAITQWHFIRTGVGWWKRGSSKQGFVSHARRESELGFKPNAPVLNSIAARHGNERRRSVTNGENSDRKNPLPFHVGPTLCLDHPWRARCSRRRHLQLHTSRRSSRKAMSVMVSIRGLPPRFPSAGGASTGASGKLGRGCSPLPNT